MFPTEEGTERTHKYRTTITGEYGEDGNILWDTMDLFESSGFWSSTPKVRLPPKVGIMITIMERSHKDMEEYGVYEPEAQDSRQEHYQRKPDSYDTEEDGKRRKVEEVPRDEPMQQDEAVDKKIIEVEESTKKDEVEEFEKKLPKIGEGIEEKMTIDGVEVHEESPLKILKDAYRFLGVGVTGSKKVLWDRLKREVASSKLKATIEISKTLEKEFQRQPEMKKDVKEPTPEERARHMLTHLPKADWCEACTTTRGREDNFSISEKKSDSSTVSMDFKFTGTRDEDRGKDPRFRPRGGGFARGAAFSTAGKPRGVGGAGTSSCRGWVCYSHTHPRHFPQKYGHERDALGSRDPSLGSCRLDPL